VLHAKTVTADGIYGTIGSFNLDFWSSHRNLEVNLTVLDPEIANQIEEQFFEDLKVSRYAQYAPRWC
jgi:cardiolipin synthase